MAQDLTTVWCDLLYDVLNNGEEVAPRGQLTKELLQKTIQVDMRRPVLRVPERGLSYRFMAAEAFWILSGDNRVVTIAPYNKNIAQFSDDGETFFGAYGPKVVEQLSYVVHKLLEDQDTRQAGLTIWRESPPQTKDVPCTVSIFFNIRNGKLNCHVFMRSSDAWLGIPYDVFNFSMLSHLVCGFLHEERSDLGIEPGTLYLTAASSHLYQRDWEAAEGYFSAKFDQRQTPEILFQKPQVLMDTLKLLRDSVPGSHGRWWEV